MCVGGQANSTSASAPRPDRRPSQGGAEVQKGLIQESGSSPTHTLTPVDPLLIFIRRLKATRKTWPLRYCADSATGQLIARYRRVLPQIELVPNKIRGEVKPRSHKDV